MKKIIFLLGVIIVLTSSCEKDDICVDGGTPNLLIRLLNNSDSLPKATTSLTVWIMEKDTLYNNVAIDSLSIPLNFNEDATTYIFENESIKDTLTFNYIRNDVFVSRSCGYITTFENISLQLTDNWIIGSEIKIESVQNEEKAHISLYH